jgi:hypothetical protein
MTRATSRRADERGEVFWIHLPVARHHHERVVRLASERERLAVPGRDRGSHAAVHRVDEEAHPRVDACANDGRGPVAARVVDDEDRVDEGGHRGEDSGDPLFFVERRHDDHHFCAVEHRSSSDLFPA